MKNKIKGKVRTKIMLFMTLISLVPFGIFTLFVYNSYVNEMQTSKISETVHSLEQADSLCASEIWRIERVAKDLCRNEEIQKKILANEKLDESMNGTVSQIIDECDKIKGIVIFPYSSEMYDYNIDVSDSDLIDFIIKFGRVTQTDGKLQWLTNENKIKNYEDYILTGTIIKDTTVNKDEKEIATIYLLVDKTIFDSVINYKNDEIFCVCDREGDMLATNNKDYDNNLCTYSMDIYNQICYNEKSFFTTKNNGVKTIVMKHLSPFTDWYWVKIIPMNIFGNEIHKIMVTALLIAFLVVVIIMSVYFMVIRKIFLPFDKIVHAMEEVENHNFDVSLKIEGDDEFSLVAGGFNKMVDEIKNLIEIRVKDEKEKMEAELNSLHYQINPHFLYNILGTMRLSALKEKQYTIADMMLKLSRLFRNCLNSKNKLVTIENDITTLEDYMDLINFRYESKIKFNIEISDNTKKCMIPRMLLQPIVENSIMHGVSDYVENKEKIPTVSVESKLFGGMLFIMVKDNGKGMTGEKLQEIMNSTDKTKNIGINNVRERLKLHYKNDFEFYVDSSVGEYTQFIIKLSPNYGQLEEFEN